MKHLKRILRILVLGICLGLFLGFLRSKLQIESGVFMTWYWITAGVILIGLVLGCVILAFGMTIVICSEAGTGPNDLVAVVLSDRLKKPFGPVRVIVDLCFALTGWLFGGVVGIGTLVCAGLVGPCAQVFMPFSGKLCGGALGKVLRNPR